MPAGFQTINDTGYLQVDGDWKNFALVSKQVLTSSSQMLVSLSFVGVQVSWPNNGDLIFFSCATRLAPLSTMVSGSGRTHYMVTMDGVGQTVTAYIFRQQPPTSSTSGAQVFDGSGVLVFDANNRFAKVVSQIPALTPGAITKWTYTAGRQYAIMVPSWYGRITQNSRPGESASPWVVVTTFAAPSITCLSDGIQQGAEITYGAIEVPIFAPNPPPDSNNYYLGQGLLIADVTGY